MQPEKKIDLLRKGAAAGLEPMELLFFCRRFLLDPEDHAEQARQQFRTLYNYNFHKKKLLSCMGSYAMHSAFQR